MNNIQEEKIEEVRKAGQRGFDLGVVFGFLLGSSSPEIFAHNNHFADEFLKKKIEELLASQKKEWIERITAINTSMPTVELPSNMHHDEFEVSKAASSLQDYIISLLSKED